MPNDLWSFALTLYARQGVEAACLQAQESGADVCLLLCGAWLERRGVPCTGPRLEQLQATAQPWQARVIAPLRQLRRSWREMAEANSELAALRERLKTLELAAERQLLLRLQQNAGTWDETEEGEPAAWLDSLLPGEENRAARQVLRDAVNQPT